jgi:hypothetical protein
VQIGAGTFSRFAIRGLFRGSFGLEHSILLDKLVDHGWLTILFDSIALRKCMEGAVNQNLNDADFHGIGFRFDSVF